MGLYETARGLISSASDYYGGYEDCCQPVVDPYTYLALLSGIGLVTWFLQMTITMTTFTPPRRKRSFLKRDAKKTSADGSCVSGLWGCMSDVFMKIFNGLHSGTFVKAMNIHSVLGQNITLSTIINTFKEVGSLPGRRNYCFGIILGWILILGCGLALDVMMCLKTLMMNVVVTMQTRH